MSLLPIILKNWLKEEMNVSAKNRNPIFMSKGKAFSVSTI